MIALNTIAMVARIALVNVIKIVVQLGFIRCEILMKFVNL